MSRNYEARVNGVEDDDDVVEDSYFADLSNFSDLDNGNDDEDFLDMYNLTPKERLVHHFKKSLHALAVRWAGLPPWQRACLVLLAVCIGIMGLLILIFHNSILHKMVEMSDDLRAKRLTGVVLVTLIFFVGFPPMIGFSLLGACTGLIYGVSLTGWTILALGAISGSVASFCVFKNLLHAQAEKLVHSNRRFEAFAAILQENNSYWVLALIRLCPFPYSLTNGAIAAVYGISVRNFSIAQLITTPKLVIYLFIGSRIRNMGETDSIGSRLLDLVSIAVTMIAFTLTAWILYVKTQRKFAEITHRDRQLNPDNDPIFDPSFEV